MILSSLVSLIVAVVLVVFVLSARLCCFVLNVRMVMLPYSLVLSAGCVTIPTARIVEIIQLFANNARQDTNYQTEHVQRISAI